MAITLAVIPHAGRIDLVGWVKRRSGRADPPRESLRKCIVELPLRPWWVGARRAELDPPYEINSSHAEYKNLPSHPEQYQYYRVPVFIAGWLWLDAEGARLFDWDDELSVLLVDPEACTAIRTALTEQDGYFGGALMQVWVRTGETGPELYGAYWILLGNLASEPPSKWGPRVVVRPVPPEFDYVR